MKHFPIEKERLRCDLEQLGLLEERTTKELNEVAERMSKLQELRYRVTNIESVKSEAVHLKQELNSKKLAMTATKNETRQRIMESEDELKRLKKHLEENDTYVQLNSLTQRIKFLESSQQHIRSGKSYNFKTFTQVSLVDAVRVRNKESAV